MLGGWRCTRDVEGGSGRRAHHGAHRALTADGPMYWGNKGLAESCEIGTGCSACDAEARELFKRLADTGIAPPHHRMRGKPPAQVRAWARERLPRIAAPS